jgi:hypothetical protein
VLAVTPAASGAESRVPLSSAAGFRLSGNYSNAEVFPNLETALRIARTHAILVISQGWQLGFDGPTWDGTVADTYLDEMKAVNPGLKIYRYLNAVYDTTATFPESWYMHDREAHRLFNTTYATYLMDPRSTEPYAADGVTSDGWIEFLANFFRKDDRTFPGVFNGGIWLDDVGGTPHVVDAVTRQPAVAVRGVGGVPWDTASWYRLTLDVSSRLNRIVGRGIFANALMSSNCYFSGCGGPVPTRQFLNRSSGLDGSMAEGWLRTWFDPFPGWPSVAAWKQNVQLLIDSNRRGHAIQLMTAVPGSATPDEVEQWRLYSFASFLIGNEGSSYFQFERSNQPKNSFEMANPLYSVDIGRPMRNALNVNGYARAHGRYFERDYTHGKVYVNPSSHAVAVSLEHAYSLPDGTIVGHLTLPAHSGSIVIGRPSASPHRKSHAVSRSIVRRVQAGWSLALHHP